MAREPDGWMSFDVRKLGDHVFANHRVNAVAQGWRYSSPRIKVGVCRAHQRVCQPAYVNLRLACWRVCCGAFAR